jgi:beta-galactosidase GanA
MSYSLLECYKIEYEAIKEHSTNIPITTNLMGFYPGLNYFEWAEHLDVISWDNYPALDTPVSHTAMTHDLMRGLKNGRPFMLMEQTPSQQNWHAVQLPETSGSDAPVELPGGSTRCRYRPVLPAAPVHRGLREVSWCCN